MGNKLSYHGGGDPTSDAYEKIKAAREKYLCSQLERDSEDCGSDSDAEDENAEHLPEDIAEHGTIAFKKRGKFYSLLDKVDKKARNVNPAEYEFPFENMVLEGGGTKGLAYCGAIRVLEELGIWPQIKRLAGASAGAMTAALLSVGYTSIHIEEFLSQDLSELFLDHECGYCSLLPNLLRGYGWNPGNRIYNWFGEQLMAKTGNKDVTFKQVLDKCGKELCVVVTNLNQMTAEYCHPKTTPNMPVRVAVRMSMAIPGIFRATKYTLHGTTDTFVDGGVLCNYPIHCFDGWWLSMQRGDGFLQKLQPLSDLPRLFERSERFGKYNDKTVGILLYADNERDVLRYMLEKRMGVELQGLPDTKLAREKLKNKKLQDNADREHRRVVRAVDAFLKTLRKHNLDGNETIEKDELWKALRDKESFSNTRRQRLFGDVDDETILQYLDRNKDGKINYNELMRFMEETGINLQTRFIGYDRKDVTSLLGFFSTLQSTLLTNIKRIYVEERDIERTIGINTGHVGTTDFVLEEGDKKFMVERGRDSTMAFLKYYVAIKNLPKKETHLEPIPENKLLAQPNDVIPAKAVMVESQKAKDESFPYVDEGAVSSTIHLANISAEEKMPILEHEEGPQS